MTSVSAVAIKKKLERVVDFRLGEGSTTKHPINIKKGTNIKAGSPPMTDGTSIFLPDNQDLFESEKDNELGLAYFVAHEADHIKDYDEYFGAEAGNLREGRTNLAEEYFQRNYSELTENPALAGWVDNVVKDYRIDSQRT